MNLSEELARVAGEAITPAEIATLLLLACAEMEDAQVHFNLMFEQYASDHTAHKIAMAKATIEHSSDINPNTAKPYNATEKEALAILDCQETLFQSELADARKTVAQEIVRNKRQEVSALQTMAANVRMELEFERVRPNT
jgi:hypothetical protein